MDKQVITADVPETGGPFNLCVRYGNLIFISGLPPFAEGYASTLREARAKGEPIPPFPDIPFEQQATIVMDHLKKLVEAAGSNMDCLLKVVVWLKDQRQQEASIASIGPISRAPRHCRRARACRPAARRWIAASKWTRSVTFLTLSVDAWPHSKRKDPRLVPGVSINLAKMS
jgi:enamine deaminase RidA (YjgF/YER057c/UK114 family)